MINSRQILVVGGGASGLMAAIAAASKGAKVYLVEKNERLGQSILATGNGRCNLSNVALDKTRAGDYYNKPEFVLPIIKSESCAVVRQRFEQLGLLTFENQAGLIYPQTNSAGSVVEVLQNQLRMLGVEALNGLQVIGINQRSDDAGGDAGGGFVIAISNGSFLSTTKVIVAYGHDALLKSVAGHRFTRQTPVLGPLQTNTQPLKGLDGLRVKCTAKLLRRRDGCGTTDLLAEQSGELLFRKYGLSGIMIFDLSRFAALGDSISLNFLDNYSRSDLLSMLKQRCADLPGYSAAQFLAGIVHHKLALAILCVLKIEPDWIVDSEDMVRLAETLQNFELQVTGGPTVKQAQVMRGGLEVGQFDPWTMQSKLTPGLFACGEALDIDAACGGFNLHWAWASGWRAGSSAAEL